MGASREAMTEASPTASKCAGVRVDGSDCGSVIVGETGFCFAHDPDLEAERRVARERGGANSSNVQRLRRHVAGSVLGSVADVLETALTQTHMGAIPPARAQAMASLARALCTVLETGELVQRVEELELRLA
jgi:hypothetical protein